MYNFETQCDLLKVKKPYQYIGGEYLSFNKDFDSALVKMAFAFPDKYEIAISNLGQKILYGVVNSDERFMADRVYAPDLDYKKILEDKNELLYSLESKRNIIDFDIVGFSLQYELAYPTVLGMLKLSGIPVLRKDRNENHPIILAGGPCCFNPAPMTDFLDLFLIGDGEDVIIELLEKYYQLKQSGENRSSIIRQLASIEGVYSSELNNRTKKKVHYFNDNEILPESPIPYSSSVHDRTVVEIRRGCGRMCRFCQAGHVNLPVRERNAKNIIDNVKKSIAETGYDEYSLLSLSSNDYTNIESVIEELSCTMNKKKVSVSLPSQRIDRYSQKLAQMVRGVRSTTVTLAPEAGSQRLRDVINKNLTEEQIIDTILNCYKNGFNHVKLYFMIGLPTETIEDLKEMAELFRKIRYRAKGLKNEFELKDGLNLTCTVSIFVPKPFTPFQWVGMNSFEQIKEKISFLLDEVKTIKGVKINYHNSFVSKLECAMTRADKRFNDFILDLHKNDVYLSTWDENIDRNLWLETALKYGIDIDKEAEKEYKINEELPWDIIDIGLDKTWLTEQYENAVNAKSIVPCEFACSDCGVCRNLKVHKVQDKPYVCENKLVQEDTLSKESYKYRIKIAKRNELRNISHLDWQNTIIKMLYRSGLDLCFSQGFNPSPKISLGIALPIFVEGENELIDIEIFNNMPEEDIKNTLNNILPTNIEVKEVQKIEKNSPAIDITAQWALYSFTPFKSGILQNKNLVYIKDKISSSNEIFIEKINKKGVKKLINIKPSIKSVSIENDTMYMILKTGQSMEIPSVKPDDIIKQFISDVDFRIIRHEFYDRNMNKL